jgi:hypothetical protein
MTLDFTKLHKLTKNTENNDGYIEENKEPF